MTDFSTIPQDVAMLILSLVPCDGGGWFHCRLVCKEFLRLCRRVQDPSKYPSCCVLESIYRNNIAAVKALVMDERVTVEPFHLFTASCARRAEIVRFLLDQKRVDLMDPQSVGRFAFRYALCGGDEEIIRTFLGNQKTVVYDSSFEDIGGCCVPCYTAQDPWFHNGKLEKGLIDLVEGHPTFCPEVWNPKPEALEFSLEEVMETIELARDKSSRGGKRWEKSHEVRIAYNYALRAYTLKNLEFARAVVESPNFAIHKEQRDYIRGLLDK